SLGRRGVRHGRVDLVSDRRRGRRAAGRYSFAKFGARYPSAGGLLEYVAWGFGNGHTTGVIAWLILAANAIVTGMAVLFGSYASTAFADGGEGWVPVFAVLAVVVMTLLNILGSKAVARAQ